MVCHQSISIEMEAKSGLTVRKVGKESLQVLFIPKYPLLPVPSADHVVKGAVEMNPRLTSHKLNLPKDGPHVNTELPNYRRP